MDKVDETIKRAAEILAVDDNEGMAADLLEAYETIRTQLAAAQAHAALHDEQIERFVDRIEAAERGRDIAMAAAEERGAKRREAIAERDRAVSLLREARPSVQHSAGATASAIGVKYAESTYTLLDCIDAALAEVK